jgi:hypothetical protein
MGVKRKHDATGRSKGEGRYVRLWHYMLGSAAWKSLSPTAKALYVELAARYAGPGSNNGKIHYSVREAATALGIGKTTAARAFMDLVDRGFVVEVTRGSFKRRPRYASEWLLTEHPSDLPDGAAVASRQFMRFPVPEAGRSVPVAGQSVPEAGQWNPKRAVSVPVAGPSRLKSAAVCT